jgi:hypothetical protein
MLSRLKRGLCKRSSWSMSIDAEAAQPSAELLQEIVVALAQREKGFGPRQLRAALDSSPLWGAGRVEDTYNLMGRALRKALSAIARQRGLAEISREAGTAAWCGRWL